LHSSRAGSRVLLIVAGLLACGLVASTWRQFGNAWDEPEHLAAGMVLLQSGQYNYDIQLPPLARLAAAIGPWLAGARLPEQPSGIGEEAGRQILYHSHASYDTLLDLARAGMLPFLLVLVFALWTWVRDARGEQEAWLALAFMLCTPVLLGHAGFVALDMPVSALCVLSFLLLQRWIERPTLARALLLGLGAGLAVSTKVSALPFLLLVAMVLLATQLLLHRLPSRRQAPPPWSRWAGTGVLAVLLAGCVSVAAYGSGLIYLTTPALAPSLVLDAFGASGWLHDTLYQWAAHTRVPLGVQEVPLNILGVKWHNEHGHEAYLLGATSMHGWWYFYLVALAVKTPLPLLLLGLGGLAWLARCGWQQRRLALLTAPLAFATILLFCCLYSHINIGVRHVLVLYPLLAVGAAAATRELWALGRRLAQPLGQSLRAVLIALLIWQATTMVYAYPDYLAYFNFSGGEHPEQILVDSDLDWGQDLRRLAHELARRHVPSLYLAYRGTADLTREGLPPFKPLPPDIPVSGWIAIDMLSLKEGRDSLGWLTAHQPVTRVGASIDLYYLPPAATAEPAGVASSASNSSSSRVMRATSAR
jgi:4-amino-4-deoxy-L-arabinose transferase-like glycosyltransferase